MVSWGTTSGREWAEEGEGRAGSGEQWRERAERDEGTATLGASGQRLGGGGFKRGRVGALRFGGSGREELPGQL